ncbi:M15 family metallopeptidase [Hyphomicrobium sp.]|uniref:M15 family metallopeptidase n=1 Tax=Hyphomicrobium sp. TaxID=82 RepID=UPI0025BF936D|nr:M15 family metallopeptidase [Hyphomicrobium sp.]MCC7252094.1 M15 family metallopeptidase [Hyphomicrobium sp.]
MPLSPILRACLVLLLVCPGSGPTRAGADVFAPPAIKRLVAAYPEAIEEIDEGWLVWRDGSRMQIDDGKGIKSFRAWLDDPDIEDMLRLSYPAGADDVPPPPEYDPGRARNAAFFDKMYGDCRKGEVKPRLTTVTWLPRKTRQRLEVTTVNGVAARLAAVSQELDRLPPEFDKFLLPAGGTYNCRVIAGTSRVSAHGYGIAIDIAVRQSDYWRWAPDALSGNIVYRNRIPLEIVHIFERHGFIWGGRWHHYDTMHFEYRPELLPPIAPLERTAPGHSLDNAAPNGAPLKK